MPHFDEMIRGEFKILEMPRAALSARVTVLLTTYNRPALLPRAIQSVLNQTFRDFHLIVLDNGSTEDMWSVVSSFKDERITYRKLHGTGRPSTSLNIGIASVVSNRTDYICWLCDDDEYHPEYLEKCVNFLDKTRDWVGVYTDASGVSQVPRFSGWIYRRLLERNFVPSTMMWKASTQVKAHEPMNVAGYEDWILWLSLAKLGPVGYIDEVLRVQHNAPDGIGRHVHLREHYYRTARVYEYFGEKKREDQSILDAFWFDKSWPCQRYFEWASRKICSYLPVRATMVAMLSWMHRCRLLS